MTAHGNDARAALMKSADRQGPMLYWILSMIWKEANMATNMLTIPYSDSLLLSLKESPAEFEAEARLLLAVKLYELGRVSTGMAAKLAGMGRVPFLFALGVLRSRLLARRPLTLSSDLAN